MNLKTNTSKWRVTFINYVKNNIKEYTLVTILFVIGLFMGVIIVNNGNLEQNQEMAGYIENFIDKFKATNNLNKMDLVMGSIKNNLILAIIIWIAGTTVIGIPVVLIAILFRGMSLGYTVSIITYTLCLRKGILFCIISLCLQNLIFIPAVLTLGVSSIKIYSSIIRDKRKENIKIEIMRHTVISLLMMGILIISSLIENLISIELLQKMIKYF